MPDPITGATPKILLLLVLLGLHVNHNDSANVLAIVPYNGKSHFIVMEPLFKELANKGHTVTVVSAFPQTKQVKNYVDVDIRHIMPTYTGTFTLDYLKNNLNNPSQVVDVICDIGKTLCEKMYDDKIFLDFLSNSTKMKYDLLITEIFGTDCFLPVAHKLDIPIASIMTSVTLPWGNDRVGNPDNPSYIPSYLLDSGERMTFVRRLYNFVLVVGSKLLNNYIHDNESYGKIRKHFEEDLPPFHEIARQRTSLVLVNSYFTINHPRPFVPNFIEIGGIHLQQPKSLPRDVESIINKSKNGFIYFSLGSMIDGSSLESHVINTFLTVFSKLPQTVFWKFENELKNVPPNVKVGKWWPQYELLVHKDIKVFITHGGLSSTIETVNSGVPILGIPMFADQPGNVNNIVRRGAGIQMKYDDITVESLSVALNKLINDKSYAENAKELSRRFKDRPLTPLQNAVFWIEYVIRHKGAKFMRSPGADLPLYQYLLLDVIAVISVAILIPVYVLSKLIKTFLKCFRRSKNNKTLNKAKKEQ